MDTASGVCVCMKSVHLASRKRYSPVRLGQLFHFWTKRVTLLLQLPYEAILQAQQGVHVCNWGKKTTTTEQMNTRNNDKAKKPITYKNHITILIIYLESNACLCPGHVLWKTLFEGRKSFHALISWVVSEVASDAAAILYSLWFHHRTDHCEILLCDTLSELLQTGSPTY